MTNTRHPVDAIAVVGMAGHFPDADGIQELWHLLLEGRESVHRLTPGELLAAGVDEHRLADPAYVPYGTRLPGAENFDAGFFRMTAAEAAHTDPQHWLFMECAWRAMEDGGIPPGTRVGVFASTGPAGYLLRHVLPAGDYARGDLPTMVRLGNHVDFLPARLAYALDLTGPTVAVQTACSSSLVGVDAACTALAMGRCDAALAGAASVRLPQPAGYLYKEGGTLSRDGHCRPFDANASGWVPGSGAAVVALKRLADAVADGDRVYAVIRGRGVSNDGADRMSFAAPSTSGQIAAITQAVASAGMPTTDIGYVEAHGSGTALGDPIEVDALAKAYAGSGGLAPGCGLGSIKANLGHLDAAAGIAGLVKAALVLHHQTVPPQINCTEVNPLLPLEHGGFVIRRQPHRPDVGIRAAAVSSLGMGGTNVHMVLTPGTEHAARPQPAGRHYDLCLSARTEDDLRTVAQDLYRHLDTHQVRIDDLSYTLNHARARFAHQLAFRARTVAEVRDALLRHLDGRTPDDVAYPLQTAGDRPPGAVKIPLPGHPCTGHDTGSAPRKATHRPPTQPRGPSPRPPAR